MVLITVLCLMKDFEKGLIDIISHFWREDVQICHNLRNVLWTSIHIVAKYEKTL